LPPVINTMISGSWLVSYSALAELAHVICSSLRLFGASVAAIALAKDTARNRANDSHSVADVLLFGARLAVDILSTAVQFVASPSEEQEDRTPLKHAGADGQHRRSSDVAIIEDRVPERDDIAPARAA
jgi:hypothetical protein